MYHQCVIRPLKITETKGEKKNSETQGMLIISGKIIVSFVLSTVHHFYDVYRISRDGGVGLKNVLFLLHGLPGEDLGEPCQWPKHNHGQHERNYDGDQLRHVVEDTGVETECTNFHKEELASIGRQKRRHDSDHKERVKAGILVNLRVLGLSRWGRLIKLQCKTNDDATDMICSKLSQSFSCQLSSRVGSF